MQQENRLNVTDKLRDPTTSEEILGIFLKDPSLFAENKRKLSATMFGNLTWLYQSMMELDEHNSLTFKSVSLINKTEIQYLVELRNSVATVHHLPRLIETLKNEALTSKLHMAAHRLTDLLSDKDPNEVLTEMQSIINNLSNTESTDLHDTEYDIDKHFLWMDEVIADPSKAYGLLTNFHEVDGITTGFHKGDFIVIGARTSMGKTAFMLEIVLRLAKNGHRIAIYSLEMSKQQMYNRMLANLMTIDYRDVQFGRIPQSRVADMKKYKELLKRIYIDDTRGVSADYITDSMKRLKRSRGLDLAVVDYIQDVKENGENNDNGGSALSRICRKLRKGAQDVVVPLIGLSQVNRSVEERKDKRPASSDLTGSAGIESSADIIAMLYREDYYDKSTKDKGVLEVNFVKHRNGETGMIKVLFNGKYQQIVPLYMGLTK